MDGTPVIAGAACLAIGVACGLLCYVVTAHGVVHTLMVRDALRERLK